MQLDRLELALRRRTAWEALDLGLVMLRRWRGPLYRAWLGSYLPFALLVFAVFWSAPGWAALIVWWLKPLFDRLLLKVLSEAVFGGQPTLRELWRALPGLLRHSALPSALLWRRLSMVRSFALPVWQLEGQRGGAARSRLKILARRTGGYAIWLTFVATHCVLIFQIGFVGLVDLLAPSSGMPAFSWGDLFSGLVDDSTVRLLNLGWLIGESLVEPFYVAAGFSLYLNRRSELEGWDIELAFRRMAERHAQAGGAPRPGGLAALALALLLGLAALPPTPAQAAPPAHAATRALSTDDEPEPPVLAAPDDEIILPTRRPRPPGVAAETTRRVLADPVFGQDVTEMRWQARQRDKPAQESRPEPWWIRKLIALADLMASGTRFALYIVMAAALLALLALLYRYRDRLPGRRAPPPIPETLFGLDLRPGSLPADIAAAALAEVDAGRCTVALSLLFRGTLLALIRRHGIEFRAGDSEDDCLRRAKARVDAPAAGVFADLLAAWKLGAYAHVVPAAEPTRALCRRWAEHYGQPAGGGAP